MFSQNDKKAVITPADVLWDMQNFCKFRNFSRQTPDVIYETLTGFIKNVSVHANKFSNTDPQKTLAIVSTVKLLLQKVRDDFKKFMPLLLKLFACHPFLSDRSYTFTLDKDDFSYYYALDFAIQRILKNVQTWDVPEGRSKTAIMVLTLWSEYPEFGPLYLGRLAEVCPYAVPYIPPDGRVAKLADERLLSIYIRFQATLIRTPNRLGLFDHPFAWLWLQNAQKQLKGGNYKNQSFCYVYREFLEMLQQELLIDNPQQYMNTLNAMQKNILPQLEGVDPSMYSLDDYIKNFLAKNDFF